ncbi:hypothetical protein [Pilimelia columellifera]|uniref:MobA-like NTP transferase domain-containing protein n=1 Tax=Pilimelia columellifera subsp. columellifera TaxID=706583 RepID=A0ABN3N6X5_9ACTN
MPTHLVTALLSPVRWTPPGVAPAAWRLAMAEDIVDLLAGLSQVDSAIVGAPADHALAAAVAWPQTAIQIRTATVGHALRAAGAAGYQAVAVLAPDVPSLPGLLVGKLLRPLTSRPVAVMPTPDGVGLAGLACVLPPPPWLPDADLDLDLDHTSVARIRASAPSPGDVVTTPAWRRLRGPADLSALDPALEGWDATRKLLESSRR